MSKYFSVKEFERCSPSCKIEDMDADFLAKLDKVREKAGIPLVLNSAYRSKEWDLSKGRSGKGDHAQGKGVDIRCNSSVNRYKIIQSAIEVGFNRIGIGKTYIHLGDGEGLANNVIWHYYV